MLWTHTVLSVIQGKWPGTLGVMCITSLSLKLFQMHRCAHMGKCTMHVCTHAHTRMCAHTHTQCRPSYIPLKIHSLPLPLAHTDTLVQTCWLKLCLRDQLRQRPQDLAQDSPHLLTFLRNSALEMKLLPFPDLCNQITIVPPNVY